MNLIVLSVIVIALLIAVLAIYLFMTGAILNRTADNLDDCLQNVKTIAMQAAAVGPGVVRLNRIGGELVGALPLLYEGAERLAAKSAPPADAPPGLGYMDVDVREAVAAAAAAPPPAGAPLGLGYMDK
ncbi:MAG: hypothetical protein ACRDSL_20690 [Pseudonocardiaceae bacterium]